jgi:hypothetical protein
MEKLKSWDALPSESEAKEIKLLLTRIVSVIVAVPAVSALLSLIVVFPVPCGYLVVGAIGVVVARSAPLVDVSVGPIIFG